MIINIKIDLNKLKEMIKEIFVKKKKINRLEINIQANKNISSSYCMEIND